MMLSLEEQALSKAAAAPLVETLLLTPNEMSENLAASLYALIIDPPVAWADVPAEQQDTYRQFVTDLITLVQRVA